MHERPETNNNPTEITTNALGIIFAFSIFYCQTDVESRKL